MQKVRRSLGRYSWFFCHLSTEETLLPYDIYICTSEYSGGFRKNIPYLYVLLKNKFVAISIGESPVIFCNRYRNVPNIQKVIEWIKHNKNILVKHWNGEVTDKKALSLLCGI